MTPTARPYALATSVSVSRSIDEVRALLLRAGATHYAYGESPESAFVQFAMDGLHYRFEVRRPTPQEAMTNANKDRGHIRRGDEIDAEWRRRWRARVLWLKATIEFAEAEPDVLSQALLANLVLPDGRTLGRWAVPQIESMYSGGQMPPLLGPGGES